MFLPLIYRPRVPACRRSGVQACRRSGVPACRRSGGPAKRVRYLTPAVTSAPTFRGTHFFFFFFIFLRKTLEALKKVYGDDNVVQIGKETVRKIY
nr:MAG TPA: hypothetical protein [Inoviridae sp.]